jgi:hypothetical protein
MTVLTALTGHSLAVGQDLVCFERRYIGALGTTPESRQSVDQVESQQNRSLGGRRTRGVSRKIDSGIDA